MPAEGAAECIFSYAIALHCILLTGLARPLPHYTLANMQSICKDEAHTPVPSCRAPVGMKRIHGRHGAQRL